MPIQLEDLGSIHGLPAEIESNLQRLVVDRKGISEDAFMRTERILGYVCPGDHYRLGRDGFTQDATGNVPEIPKAVEPAHTVLNGRWDSDIDFVSEEANILGGNGCYTLPDGEDELCIRQAEPNPEHLAYYGGRLVRVGDALRFDTDAPLPVTEISIGKTYAVDFLLKSANGGGEFLETHDRPHFHMPLDEEVEGHLFIGKRDADGLTKISAFQIPYGFGIMMPPWVIHADSHLVGRYLVVYSVTKTFSTVTIRKSNGDFAQISVV